MAFEYRIFPEQQLLTTRFYGVVTEQDFRQLRADIQCDPFYDPGYRILDDLTDVKEVDISADRLSEFAVSTIARPHSRRALVVTSDFQRGMARMYRSLSVFAGQDFMIFNDMKQAMLWVTSQDGARRGEQMAGEETVI